MSRRMTRASLKAGLRKDADPCSSPSVPGPSPSASSESTGPPPLRFPDQMAWEQWLQRSHGESQGVWLQMAKKNAERPTVTYDEAVDAALCFGWIDGQRKALDAQHFVQRFTPRRRNSLWSRRNVGKVAALTAAGRMRPAGQAEVDAARADGRWDRAYSSPSVMEVPADFEGALRDNAEAKRFFDALGRTQRYVFLWRIETTRRPETRKRKIGEFVDLLSQRKLLQ
ncbi:hypothetical protein CTA2_1517 [Colletotrichum tanaceti]|uniref:Bacteriocin-protection protein n=1 Tax=Colletotrichum tanaceti TaxID=1306861 RepID=A0A4U6X3Y7_9PEZI|nr:hypothetical protein CTA2_1517 [Colletotrichum tanaceti]TKW49724.1 hypothetical protein CTA1_148 [Colletotrichum tanaceti]